MTSSECASVLEALSDDPMPYAGGGLTLILDALSKIQSDATNVMCEPRGSKQRKTSCGSVGGARAIADDFNAQHGQDLTNGLCRSLTAKDWAFIDDATKNLDEKYDLVARRFRRMGIKSASQQTRKWVAAMLGLTAFDNLPSADVLYRMTFSFDRVVSSVCGNLSVPWSLISSYPDNPKDLPSEVFANAYDEDDPPIDRYVNGLMHVANTAVPCRSNSKLLRGAHLHGLGW